MSNNYLKNFLFFLLIIISCAYSKQNKLPRFVAISSSKVNVHVGPGFNYPVQWQFCKKYTPVELIGEFDIWRLIRDFDNHQGWVHKNLLNFTARYVMTSNKEQNIYKNRDLSSKVIVIASYKVILKVLEIKDDWLFVQVNWKDNKYKGWIQRKNVWGLYKNE